MDEIKLGDRARDTITGFEGIVTGRCEYLNASALLRLERDAVVDGKTHSEWFDESRIVPMPG